jgi:hypothetical protein
MKIGDKVRIINPSSHFYGVLGEIITKGNGNNWQVEVFSGVGIYYFESELKTEEIDNA